MSLQILITRQQIAERITILARKIQKELDNGDPVHVLILLNGGLMFASDLLRELPSHFLMDTVRISSYGRESTSSGTVKCSENWADVTGQTVLVVDDVLDTGLTLESVCRKLKEQGASRVCTVVAVDKKGQRKVNFEADFVGFTAGREFLVGYGMDYADKYRNLPYIALMNEE